ESYYQSQEEMPTFQTEAGMVLGTVAYMSPEQAEGRDVDARSDIFSFGALLYELVTGRSAFQRESAVASLSAILRDEPREPREISQDVPENLSRLIIRCLRKNPAQRPQSVAALVSELRGTTSKKGEEEERTSIAV